MNKSGLPVILNCLTKRLVSTVNVTFERGRMRLNRRGPCKNTKIIKSGMDSATLGQRSDMPSRCDRRGDRDNGRIAATE